MTFDEVLAQVLALLQREQRVAYRALKVRFQLDDDLVEAVKDELIYAKKRAVDEDNRVLVWVGEHEATSAPPSVPATPVLTSAPAPDHAHEPLSYTPKHLAEKILTSRNALEGERKQVTVLFCDLANSTRIAERIGPEAMHTLLNRFFEVALNAVHRYEGTINQFLGDGFMALFGAPIAHEDHARRGVLSALALQRTLKEADLGKPYGEACQFRMGLNSGLVVVGSIGDNLRMDYSAIGDTTNLAARLQQLAEPGTILVSESTTRLVQGAVRLEALAPVEVSERMTPPLDAAQLLPVYAGRGRVWLLLRQNAAAIADFQQMRDLARTAGHPRQEGESLCHLAHAHYENSSEGDFLLAEQYAQEAQHLAQLLGDAEILARSLASLGLFAMWRGNMAAADRHLAASLQISRREGDQDALVTTLWTLSIKSYWQGKFPPAIHSAQESVRIARLIHDGFHELYSLVFLCLARWSGGDYPQAFRVTHEVLTKAHERQNMFFLSRAKNQLGWFHRELGAVTRAAELDHESRDLGRTHGIAIVEISALVNLGLDFLALGQPGRALSYLAPTLDRVDREAVGLHRWRWKIRLCLGLAELFYTTGDYDQAFRYVEEGLKEAQATTSQKYVALGWALRGKIIAKLGNADTAGTELQRAFSLAEQLQSPSLVYPIAYGLGQWYETTGKEREAASLYSQAKATIAQMATAVEDEQLRSTFLQSALVQEIHERAARLGG